MWNMMRKGKWLERRADQREPAPELDALYSTELEQKKVRIKDISATGVYVLTQDPVQPGTDLELTLQKSSVPKEKDELLGLVDEAPPAEVQLRCKAVRIGQDGVGMAFEPESATATWIKVVGLVSNLTGESDRIRLFRESKALEFVLRVSAEAVPDLLEMIKTRMSREQSAKAFEIALMAERIAATRPGALRHDVSAKLVLRILEDGSKVDEEQTRRMWAELLAASAAENARDVVNLNYAAILSRIDAVQMRILEAACRLAIQVGWEHGLKFREDLHRDAQAIQKITHLQNLMAIERDLHHLYELGLVELTDRPILCEQVERVNMTPTHLALKLYAQCKGQPEPPEVLEGAKLQKAS